MRGSWLSNIFTSIGNNFANLLNLLPLDLPNDTNATTLLLLWFIFTLLGCTADRR